MAPRVLCCDAASGVLKSAVIGHASHVTNGTRPSAGKRTTSTFMGSLTACFVTLAKVVRTPTCQKRLSAAPKVRYTQMVRHGVQEQVGHLSMTGPGSPPGPRTRLVSGEGICRGRGREVLGLAPPFAFPMIIEIAQAYE